MFVKFGHLSHCTGKDRLQKKKFIFFSSSSPEGGINKTQKQEQVTNVFSRIIIKKEGGLYNQTNSEDKDLAHSKVQDLLLTIRDMPSVAGSLILSLIPEDW